MPRPRISPTTARGKTGGHTKTATAGKPTTPVVTRVGAGNSTPLKNHLPTVTIPVARNSHAATTTPNRGLRLDAPHPPPKHSASQLSEEPQAGPHLWLALHADDLIDRMQAWASKLDSRESQLNLYSALQDQRERQFRMKQQDILAQLSEQQRSVDRLRERMEAQARRLTFRAAG